MTVSFRTANGRAVLILTFLVLATSLPFVNRAYFVDDYYFVTMAKGILQHPLRPYDFVSDDAGRATVAWERGQRPRMVNPPLFHYFLAGVMRVWGDAVWKLRTASLVFPLISVWCMYFLGKRFIRDPLAAASLMAVTPAFWLTSYSLLIDGALLAFFLASLLAFIEGQERRSLSLIILSGLLMGCTVLVKYTGIIALPLVLVWHLLYRERCSKFLTFTALAIFALVFSGWEASTMVSYGQMHIVATLPRGFHSASPLGLLGFVLVGSGVLIRRAKGLSSLRRMLFSWICWGAAGLVMVGQLKAQASLQGWLTTFYLDKVLVLGSFFGGGTVFLLLAFSYLCRRSKLWWAVSVLVSLLLFFCFRSRVGMFTTGQSALLAVFIGSSFAFLCLSGGALQVDDPRSLLFVRLWLAMALLELIVVMPWTAGRYLLLVLPPAIWIIRAVVEEAGWYRSWRAAWFLTLVMGGALAYVDYAQAGTIRRIADVLAAKESELQRLSPRPPHEWFYLGDTFSGYPAYLAPLGWKSAFPGEHFQSGDLLLRSRYRTSSWWKLPDRIHLQPVGEEEFPCRLPLRVMDVPDSAGFYASVWGSLPYVITEHPLEQFELDRVAE